MNTIKAIGNLNNSELAQGLTGGASWHADYAKSAYIFFGNLDYRMNEGDVVIVFSQYGEIVDCRLVRDKITGKSKGFGFLAYEDQRSTVLAVDNLNGAEVLGRPLRVDHVKNYKIPTEYLNIDESELKEGETIEDKLYKPTGPDGKGWGEFRQLNEVDIKKLEETFNDLNQKEAVKNVDKDQLILDEDERWEKMFQKQQDNVQEEELMQSNEMQAEIERLRRELAEKNRQIKEKRKKDKKKHKDGKKEKKDKKEKKEKKKDKKREKKEKSKQRLDSD